MNEKKGKALVMKLFDDLMAEESLSKNHDQDPLKKEPPHAEDEPETRVSRVKVDPMEIAQGPSLQKSNDMSDDATVKLSPSKIAISTNEMKSETHGSRSSSSKPHDETIKGHLQPESGEVKASVGRYSPLRSGGFSSATEAALASSENLRIAQNRILELEQELTRLRNDNEQLGAAGETLRRLSDELQSQVTGLQGKMDRSLELKSHEIELLHQTQSKKDKEISSLKSKVEEFEIRLSTNIQKIRVRERELENRLELVKMESSALVRNKDEIILDLKRQVDQLNLELENYRNKAQELNKQLGDRQEMLHRTVKALRLALSMLENEDNPNLVHQKKGK